MNDSSIELRNQINNLEKEISNLKTKLNILTAEKNILENINYHTIKTSRTNNIYRNTNYSLFILFLFLGINLILYYNDLIQPNKIKILFYIFFIAFILIIGYNRMKTNSIDNDILELQKSNSNKLNQIKLDIIITNNQILKIKIEITNLYKSLQFLTNII
jgi:Tfp pilus assembly protein PilO